MGYGDHGVFFFFVLLMVGEGGVDGRLWVTGGGGVRCV